MSLHTALIQQNSCAVLGCFKLSRDDKIKFNAISKRRKIAPLFLAEAAIGAKSSIRQIELFTDLRYK
ncbi:hypothetical protein [Sulfitobacter undariae]|uniref:hypothetical protein n=1 Tax=Sulfitobacter undariae TaxID=1563671 RepID=UPI00161C8685|nr:hypothetical protein [Sulfitobacter undariae]